MMMRHRAKFLAPLFIIFLLAGLTIFYLQNNSTTTQNQITVTPTQKPVLTPTSAKQQIKIYLVALEDGGKSGEEIGCGDSLVPVTREIPTTKGVLRESLNNLFALKEQYFGESGLYNSLYNSDLKVDDAMVENGTAKVYLMGDLSVGGTCDSPRIEGQIRATSLQFESVEKVEIFLNGEPLSEALSQK